MTDKLRAILQYRALMMALSFIMSLSFLAAPIGDAGFYLFCIAVAIILIIIPLQTIIDIQELLRDGNESR
ncbi:hypothetical protein [Sulfurovum mangrovi]|uniref:hypothetical protein n=1 Tax=Sulfurovum mangrovi TaxID=2893889 RepID=UPI001E5C5658|nr:hypothetical protein [Sulfurovum mangrovi]UFH59827.1 hypothetical protein LN246_03040 [Sulfurovum mangrovi]UFH59878.1 hypothetical protein LN246_03300 [Sulfurovum mangrovi]